MNSGHLLFAFFYQDKHGICYYLLQEVKIYTWYEVKISYPAAYVQMSFFQIFVIFLDTTLITSLLKVLSALQIPAMFSLQLKRGVSDVGMIRQRKLLNTEKLIFKAEDLDEINRQGGLYVLVTVEPEGSVTIPDVQERESILFNISNLLFCHYLEYDSTLFFPVVNIELEQPVSYFKCMLSILGTFIVFVVIFPGFSLYLRVYEFQKYAAFSRNGAGVGMGWKNLSDLGNGLTTAMTIILVEWVVMLFLASYFDQVVSSGDGKKRVPYFSYNA
ncbi:ABC transporter A family member 5 [Bienertia sinuspersici]